MPGASRLDPSQSRTLFTLSCGAFASQASIRLCDPMLPQLAAEFGRPLGDAAHTVTAFTIAYGLMQLVHGPTGDRFGKLRVVRYATIAAALASLACMLAATLGQLVALRLLAGGACAALIPLSMAWIGDAVPYEARQRVLARLMTGATLGLVFGQVAGGVLADTVGWRLGFGFPAIVFVAVGAALTIDARRARAAPAQAPQPPAQEPVRRGLHAVATPFASVLALPWARLVVATVFVEGFLVYGIFAFVPSWLHVDFGMPLWQCGLAAAGIGAGGLAYTLASHWLIPRLGERGLVVAGGALFALGIVSLGGPWWPAQAASCALAGMGFFMLHNTLQTLATQMAPQVRGTAIAAFAFCLFAGQSAGVATASRLVAAIGYRETFVASSLALLVLCAALVFALARRSRAA